MLREHATETFWVEVDGAEHLLPFAKADVFAWNEPVGVAATGGVLSGVRFEYTQVDAGGKLRGTGEFFALAADVVLKAIGQVMLTEGLVEGGTDLLRLDKGRIAVDADFATSLAGVWAGGDCVGGKTDLTVQSVADGKHAAAAIHAYLTKA